MFAFPGVGHESHLEGVDDTCAATRVDWSRPSRSRKVASKRWVGRTPGWGVAGHEKRFAGAWTLRFASSSIFTDGVPATGVSPSRMHSHSTFRRHCAYRPTGSRRPPHPRHSGPLRSRLLVNLLPSSFALPTLSRASLPFSSSDSSDFFQICTRCMMEVKQERES